MSAIPVAKQWRERNGYVGRGGVVVVFQGKVQGWADMLRYPNHWCPGCVAVDEEGRSWTSFGCT